MLAPGEYLTRPVPPEPTPTRPPEPTPMAPPTPAPAAEVKETESRSFLLTLLRALGAIHT